MFPVRYELGFYIPEDGILHTHRRENLKSYRDYLRNSMQTGSEAHPVYCLRSGHRRNIRPWDAVHNESSHSPSSGGSVVTYTPPHQHPVRTMCLGTFLFLLGQVIPFIRYQFNRMLLSIYLHGQR
jgi:hypothetical protein